MIANQQHGDIFSITTAGFIVLEDLLDQDHVQDLGGPRTILQGEVTAEILSPGSIYPWVSEDAAGLGRLDLSGIKSKGSWGLTDARRGRAS